MTNNILRFPVRISRESYFEAHNNLTALLERTEKLLIACQNTKNEYEQVAEAIESGDLSRMTRLREELHNTRRSKSYI